MTTHEKTPYQHWPVIGHWANEQLQRNSQAAVAVKIDKLLSAQMADLPQTLSLSNYPNPFETTTTIELGLPQKSRILMRVLNIKGEVLKIMADEELFAG